MKSLVILLGVCALVCVTYAAPLTDLNRKCIGFLYTFSYMRKTYCSRNNVCWVDKGLGWPLHVV